MKILHAIIRPIWKIWFFICFAVPFLLLFPIFFYALFNGKYDLVYNLKRLWARIISWLTFLFPNIQYKKQKYLLPKPCVIVCNHTSYLDIVFSPFYITHTAVYMGKAELLKIPLFKYFFVYLDIPVRRKSATDSHRAFVRAGEIIDRGMSMVIYPEGTISPKGKLKPFKNGAFKLAIEKQVPVVPVVNLNNWHFLENGGFFKSNGRPGIPQIIVGEPIETKGLDIEQIEELKNKVYTFIKSELDTFYDKKN